MSYTIQAQTRTERRWYLAARQRADYAREGNHRHTADLQDSGLLDGRRGRDIPAVGLVDLQPPGGAAGLRAHRL